MFVNFHRKLAFVALKDSELLWRIFFIDDFLVFFYIRNLGKN